MRRRISLNNLVKIITVIGISVVIGAVTIGVLRNQTDRELAQDNQELKNQRDCATAGNKFMQDKQALGFIFSDTQYHFSKKINTCLVYFKSNVLNQGLKAYVIQDVYTDVVLARHVLENGQPKTGSGFSSQQEFVDFYKATFLN